MTLTREETIERLKQNKAAAEYYAGQSQITAEIENALKDSEAFDMAIEALSPRRREDATEEDYAYCDDCEAVEMCMWYPYDGCIFKIQSRPKGEWIPCSERLPSECEVVLASWSCLWKDAIVLARRYEGKWEWAYEHGTDYWQPTELEEYWPEAWQPLPAPYKGGDAE